MGIRLIAVGRLLPALAIVGLAIGPLAAQSPGVEERLSALEEELENAKLDRATKQYRSVGGMGPAASEVYHIDEGLSWGGYGEIKHRDFRSEFRADQTDVHRFILYAGYRFNDWIVLNSEIEYEHAGFEEKTAVTGVNFTNRTTTTTKVNSSEVFVEFAYIDLEFAKAFQLQLGLNLLPVGITNMRHEPTTFLAVERSRTETNLIPSTWREIGALAHGQIGDWLYYRTGVVSGGRGVSFSDSTWIRDGRTKGSLARSQDWAYVFAADVTPVEGVTIGGSYYVGDNGQGEVSRVTWNNRLNDPLAGLSDGTGLLAAYTTAQTNRLKSGAVRVHIAEGHGELDYGPWKGRALYAEGWMNEQDARSVNNATNKNIGQRVWGGYGELGFNVLSFIETAHKLYPFVRYERLNTQWKTVERYAGGVEDLEDAICAELGASCRTNTNNATGNRNLGVIQSSEAAREAYGVRGAANRSNDRSIVTGGVAYFPHPNVVLKLEYERHETASTYDGDIEPLRPSNNKVDQINASVGFIF